MLHHARAACGNLAVSSLHCHLICLHSLVELSCLREQTNCWELAS